MTVHVDRQGVAYTPTQYAFVSVIRSKAEWRASELRTLSLFPPGMRNNEVGKALNWFCGLRKYRVRSIKVPGGSVNLYPSAAIIELLTPG